MKSNRFLYSHLIMDPPRGRLVWYPRWFFDLRTNYEENGGRKLLTGHVELAVNKPAPEASFMIKVGSSGSETPFDAHVGLFGTTLYWGIEQGHHLADLITQVWFNRIPSRPMRKCLDPHGDCGCPPYNPEGNNSSFKRHIGHNGGPAKHRYDGREINLFISEGRLYTAFWTIPGSWSRGQFAEWRSKSYKLNPLDILWGERRYWYDDLETGQILVQMPEALYPVQVKLQRQRFGRPKLPNRHQESHVVEVKADECKGIPSHYDPSGGWKGDRTWGFSVKLKQGHRRDWLIDAKAAIEAWVLQSRADSGFREPLPLERETS